MILKPICDAYAGLKKDGISGILEHFSTGNGISVEGISPAASPLLIASLFHSTGRQVVAVTPDISAMRDLVIDLSCFMDADRIFTLPPWETLPYDFVSAPESIERERVTALYRMISGAPAVIVATAESMIRKIPSKQFLLKRGLRLETGDEYPFDDIAATLVQYGYSREPRVETYGQFSVKGGIIDIYLPSLANPVRLDFFGDTLDSVREFDIESQISTGVRKGVTVYPRREIILFESETKKLLSLLETALLEGRHFPESITAKIDGGDIAGMRGVEDLFPLIIDAAGPAGHIHETAITVVTDPMETVTARNMLEKTFDELYRRKGHRTLSLPPAELLDLEGFTELSARSIILSGIRSRNDSLNPDLKSVPSFQGRIKQAREEISRYLDTGWQVTVATGFDGQARRLFDLLSDYKPDSDFEKITEDSPFNIVMAPLRQGLSIGPLKHLLISDQDIFGKSYRRRARFKRKGSRPIESFLDLSENDFVVHINHGIGVFKGIERMTAGGVERDFLVINYAGDDKLYVSLDQITMVQKYIGLEGRPPRVDHLGRQSSWNRIKKRVQDAVDEIAAELMKIYSKRSVHKGYRFPPDTLWQEEFESLFEYEETPDQITAIEDVKDDMESEKPMDRLVCGDVGFGKTEVAIRAAFKAVMAGRQVAILVPTTVLAMQHYTTFSKRFAEYPVEIEMISRFRSQAEISRVKKLLAVGRGDIVIGTHALLSEGLKIKNLGLLIIDEEQRFGVSHKEKLKKIKATVDVMTLSATPIPRTLHMAVSGIRDLSVIATPPENRHSIETFVLEENPEMLRNAILAEIHRQGQIFFVHNRVQSIDARASALRDLVPEATFRTAHGQMAEHELEETMIDFLKGEFDVLVSTTIIESGLDIPNVNTIIIDRADTFGLSQLYQLKGRVGRAGRQAYAYLFYPANKPITEEAGKRLRVISEFTELGSGFKVAMKDLEIRGAGNILGREQSGNIMEVGFDLYSQMLENAVREIKGEKPLQHFRTPVFLSVDFFIPDNYISDQRQKIEFYKRFESCETEKEVDALEKEMADRFGPVPERVKILVNLEKIRAIASSIYLEEIAEDAKAVRFRFSSDTAVDIPKMMELISKNRKFSFDPQDPNLLLYKIQDKTPEKKLEEIKKFLQQISQGLTSAG
jgi:transcription-repair coupling factor (superfamily II helicase)